MSIFRGRQVVVFLGATSPRLPHLAAVNAVIAEAAQEEGAAIVQIPEDIPRASDGVHYGSSGYRKLAAFINQTVENLFGK